MLTVKSGVITVPATTRATKTAITVHPYYYHCGYKLTASTLEITSTSIVCSVETQRPHKN